MDLNDLEFDLKLPEILKLTKVYRLSAMPMEEGIKLLADTKTDYDRRVGPVLARKIYLMLTSLTGTEIIDEN